MLFALARHFDWWSTKMITEFEIDGGRADLLLISKAGYATEIEIKISAKDWRIDQSKKKFRADRPHISRLFYAAPAPLLARLDIHNTKWIKRHVGILSIDGDGVSQDTVREIRAAKRFSCQRVPQDLVGRMQSAFYYRFWRQHMDIQSRRLHNERKDG